MAVYTRAHKRKLIKKSRTLPVYGEGEDKDKYFRCWNCGFICNVDRDELGDSESSSGNEHTDYHETHHCSTYDPPAGVLGPERLTNISFEIGDPPTGWAAGNSADLDRHANPNSGTYCLEINENGVAAPNANQTITVCVGENFKFSVYLIEGTGTSWRMLIYDNQNAQYLAAIGGSATDEYIQHSTEFVIPSGCSTILAGLVHNADAAAGTTLFFDDASLRKVLFPSPDNASRYAVLGGDIGHYQVAQNIVTPDEVAKTIKHYYTSDISRGCPFCGCTNYRGDY